MTSFGYQFISVLLLMRTCVDLTVAYDHTIVVNNDPDQPQCKFTIGKYMCGSLANTFDLLNKINTSVDVIIKPANYRLVSSHNLTDLHDVNLTGSVVGSTPVIISCRQGSDTGISFIRVRNLLVQYVHIKWCGMVHVSTSQVTSSKRLFQFVYFRSAVYFQNCTNLSMTNIKIYDNNGIGMAIVDSNGTINITYSEFMNNSLNSVEQTANFTGGGGLYIEFTACTPGLPKCDPSTNLYNQQAKYFIDQCIFDGNKNTYIAIDPDQPASGYHVTFGCGGGLSIWLFGNASNNSFFISSEFSGNVANRGGGLTIDFRDNSANTIVEIFQSNLRDNMVTIYQGGGGALIGYAIYHFDESLRYNYIKLSGCNFNQNTAPNGNGGGLAFYGSHEPNVPSSTNYIEISQCHFEGNVAQFGSAISIMKEYYEVIPRGVLLTFIITNCSLISNNAIDNENILMFGNYTYNSWLGAIAVTGFSIQFRSSNLISNHTSTALLLDNAIVEFYHNSSVTFSFNRGLKGGAMLLLQGSYIRLFPNANITFYNNTAVKSGGAVFVEMISPYDFLQSHICFFRNHNNSPPSNWSDVTIEFTDNSNPTVFASTLHPCDKEYSQSNVSFLLLHPFHYYPNITQNTIATLPSQISVLNRTISESPGRTFSLPVYLTDELNHIVTNSVLIVSCNSGRKQAHYSPQVLSPYQYTNSLVQIAGKPTETCNLEIQTDDNYQISTTMTVHLSKCPPGYIFDGQVEQCVCLHAKLSGNPVILLCDPLQFRAYVNPAYWVGFKTNNATVFAASPCPFGYCYGSGLFRDGILLTQEANKTVLDKQVCGTVSRTGMLCGQCIENYSVAMNSPEFSCHNCKHHRFGVIFFILSYIIPITVLFYLIMTYNIRVTSGLFGAFLFFAQIIGSEINFAFNYDINAATNGEFVFSKILFAIYSIFNLEPFQHDVFSYCLFGNIGTVDILAFKLFASLYPFGLIVVYSLLRCYCRSRCLRHWLHRCRFTNRAVTSGLSAFLVLCFAKINVLAFAILKQVDVAYIDSEGRWKSQKTVVYLQGSLEYFGSYHTAYAAGALTVLVVIITIPTALLLIHPLILNLLGNLGMGESGLMNCINRCLCINRLRPMLDSFQGNYKNSMKFFAGLHFFLYRTLVFCAIIATPTSSIGNLQLILIILFLIILGVHIITSPFRNQVDNVAHSIVYLLIIVLLGILYLYISDEGFSFAIYLGTALSSLPLLILAGYITWMLLQRAKVLRARYHGYINLDNDIQD